IYFMFRGKRIIHMIWICKKSTYNNRLVYKKQRIKQYRKSRKKPAAYTAVYFKLVIENITIMIFAVFSAISFLFISE
ncbi:MAG: hypothetical protein ACLUQK_18415, partial [Clostridium sp.]